MDVIAPGIIANGRPYYVSLSLSPDHSTVTIAAKPMAVILSAPKLEAAIAANTAAVTAQTSELSEVKQKLADILTAIQAPTPDPEDAPAVAGANAELKLSSEALADAIQSAQP